MKKKFLVLFVAVLLVSGCSLIEEDNPSEEAMETETVETINETIDLLTDLEMDDYGFYSSLETEYNLLDGKFDDILEEYPENAVGNLGKSFTSIASLYFDEDMSGSVPVELIAASSGEMPFEFSPESVFNIRTTLTSIENWTDVVENNFLPVLTSAIGYLKIAIDNMDDSILVTADVNSDIEENIEIDVTDLYSIYAGLNFVKGSVELILTWDYMMVDEDGNKLDIYDAINDNTYSIDQIRDLIKKNLDSRDSQSTFLSFYNSQYLTDSKNSYLKALQAVIDFETSLNAETDDQSDDAIPSGEMEMPEGFQETFEDYFQNVGITDDISSISDIANVITGIINGEKDLETPFATIHVDAYFNLAETSPDGLRSFLPDYDSEEDSFSLSDNFDTTLGGVVDQDDIDSDSILNFYLYLMGILNKIN